MIDLPSINLPSDFLHLLKMKVHDDFESLDGPFRYIASRPSFHNLIMTRISQKSLEYNGRLEAILKDLTWPVFRYKMASLYFHHHKNGKFPQVIDFDYFDEMKGLEKILQKHTIPGLHYPFIFVVYLKFSALKLPAGITKFLKHIQFKMERIDLIILFLWHGIEFFGEEGLEEFLELPDVDYESLITQFTDTQLKTYFKNMLCYAYSINDSDTIYSGHLK